MRNQDCQPIVRELLAHHRSGEPWRTQSTKVPADAYVSKARLRSERELLFDRKPQVMALTSDLPEPGCHITRDDSRVPIVIIRDDNGHAQAWANVCAHRGARVSDDVRGCSRRFTCPYHAWTYDTGGDLVGFPDRESFPGVEAPGPGLKALPTLEENGLIWVIPDPGSDSDPSVDLGAIADDFESFDIESHEHWRSHHFDLELNWKLVIDTFLEPYHFGSLHKFTVGPIFMANLCHAERFGDHIREVLPRKSLATLESVSPDEWDLIPHSALVYVLFPNTVFVMQVDHIETWRVTPHPTDPGRSTCDLDFYIPRGPMTESALGHWERNWKLTIDTVIDEDFLAMAGVQRGLASGAIDELRVGSNEPALAMFHEALANSLGDTALGDTALGDTALRG